MLEPIHPDESPLELVITPPLEGAPLRVPVHRVLTTIGSADESDVRLPHVAGRWAILQRDGAGVVLHLFGSGARHHLDPGARLVVDDLALELREREAGPLQLERLAERLAGVEAPADALRLLLDFVISQTGASTGAIVMAEQGGYSVTVARGDADGQRLDPAALLSDTVITDVLSRGLPLCVDDAATHSRYGTVPSVVLRRVRAFLCLPMLLGGRVMGALYLGKRAGESRFSEDQVRDLRVLAGMAVPFLILLRRAALRPGPEIEAPFGESAAMIEVRRTIDKVAPTDLTVLLSGETGTGKEVAARAIHRQSRRADRPLVIVNCSAVPEALLEAELFGCKKGAFTGAVQDRVGRIETAHHGTLFLDEVGDMPLGMQAALLRVLQEHEVTRLGENTSRPVDFRLVAATHRDLPAEVAAGRFREDLMFRLREVTLQLPRLRDRDDDVLLLARLFLHQAVHELVLPARTLSRGAEDAIAGYQWPGNVRELRATMRRAAVMCDGLEVSAEELGLPPSRASLEPASHVSDAAPPREAHEPSSAALPSQEGCLVFTDFSLPLPRARAEFVARYVAAVVERHGGDRRAATRALGISLRSLYRYLGWAHEAHEAWDSIARSGHEHDDA